LKKVSGGVGREERNNLLEFGGDSDPGIFNLVNSLATQGHIATRKAWRCTDKKKARLILLVFPATPRFLFSL